MKVSFLLLENRGHIWAIMFVIKCFELWEHAGFKEGIIQINFLVEYIIKGIDNKISVAPLGKLHLPGNLVIILVSFLEVNAAVDLFQKIKVVPWGNFLPSSCKGTFCLNHCIFSLDEAVRRCTQIWVLGMDAETTLEQFFPGYF